ncbi:Dihydrolipoyllysine-residue succinyltransferase component of 2-oxoglutarate dehydrogenase complex [Buchnera aphidicola (Eriosoma lanigerum)]|uniref:dihydrolipoyllysine-residue succinyltransferase n=1 Tax=Buchnera aphidicola TaxID=9 RepID=UPI0034643629
MKNIDILVPELPDSISDATVSLWHKKIGDSVKTNELIVDIETDKIMLEVVSSTNGILHKILEIEGNIVRSRQKLGIIQPLLIDASQNKNNILTNDYSNNDVINNKVKNNINTDNITPTIRKLIKTHNLNSDSIANRTGVKGRITRQDVHNYLEQENIYNIQNKLNNTVINNDTKLIERKKTVVPMSRLRQRISERLLETKNNTAMLTTFNEVNMQPIIQIRKQYGENFKKKYNIKLGFMSFYVKAVIEALKRYPDINASIHNKDIIYYNYYDINIAISTPRGLITPVLKDADKMSMYVIETNIKEYVSKSLLGKISIEELTGGTFTITNGGTFGSLMSTPIINPPQTGILGIHAIKNRPMAINDEIKILPMMYLALSYDHRLIDGKIAVQFLVTIKDLLEDFSRLILEI